MYLKLLISLLDSFSWLCTFLWVGEGCFETDVSLCNSPTCPEAHFVEQADLKLIEIHLHLPLKYWA